MTDNCIIKFPLIIKWNITSKCNLLCRHCFLNSYVEEPKLEKVIEIIKELNNKKVAAVCITGGEPLMRGDLEEIVQALHKNKIKTMIATNGTLLSEKRVNQLIKNGVTQYQISLDGHNKELNDYFRGKGSFSKAIYAIKELKSKGAEVIIAHTLNKLNYVYFKNMIELAEELNSDILRFELFIPLGRGRTNQTLLELDNKSMQFIRDEVMRAKAEKIIMKLPTFNSRYGCGAGFFNCVINSDFTLSPCDMLAETYKTKAFRNVNELEDMWINSHVFNEWRAIKVNDEYCNLCKYSSKCNNGCRASALAYNNNLSGTDNLCIYRNYNKQSDDFGKV